jgi:hypothetical protein
MQGLNNDAESWDGVEKSNILGALDALNQQYPPASELEPQQRLARNLFTISLDHILGSFVTVHEYRKLNSILQNPGLHEKLIFNAFDLITPIDDKEVLRTHYSEINQNGSPLRYTEIARRWGVTKQYISFAAKRGRETFVEEILRLYSD